MSVLRKIAYTISVFSLLFIALSFTERPYWAYYDLACVDESLEVAPETIVIMGGNGMPSPSGLMRLYHGASVANEYPKANVIIALPYNEVDSSKQLELMAYELVIKGIDTNRIIFEPHGYNTRSQAEEIAKLITDKSDPLLIVSSPEHMYRCLATFRKVGFETVGSHPTFEIPSDEIALSKKKKGKKRKARNLALRYNMWSYMQYEIIVLREYVAITYYWMNGWI